MPDTILRRDFSNGEFPVLFFGTNDYYWINKSKAFLYMEGDDKKKITTHGKGLDKQFKKAMEEVVIAYENYKQNKTKIFQSKTIHPTPYFHLKVVSINFFKSKIQLLIFVFFIFKKRLINHSVNVSRLS